MYKPPSKSAFSLVELSIVLVILGLLVGGVLAGKSLIKASELRSVTRDFQKYHAAVMTFKDKYFYYPGDLPNATVIWGLADGTTAANDATCNAFVSTDSKTCNGNGNGWIGDILGAAEAYRSWQHLANASLIEGQYYGAKDLATGVGSTYLTPGLNIPSGKISRSGFLLGTVGMGWGQATSFQADDAATRYTYSGQYFLLITPLTTFSGGSPGSTPFWGALSHEDAWNLDSKMDDGVATTGKIRADVIKQTAVAPANVILGMTCRVYDPTNTTNTCALGYIFGQ